ncbi:MAG: class I SAM-dependent methyltransferase [Verrucomicrobia bacterium]|nr:class I SAM-dependent methyltransferase [Verrucomicrobiota bacterium]
MPSYDLSKHDLLEREVARLPLQAQVLFPFEAPFLKLHGVTDSSSLWDIGCGDGSWLRLFRSAFPNSTSAGLDHSPEILDYARKQNPGVRLLLVDEKNISELLLHGEFDVALLRFSLQHMSPDVRNRILSALGSRKALTRVIAIEGDDHSFAFRPPCEAIRTLLEAKGRKQAAQGGDRHIGSRLPELFSRLGFGLVRQDSIPITSKIGWDTWWNVLGPVILSGADKTQYGLVDQAISWFERNRDNEHALMTASLYMVSASNSSEPP